MSKIHLFSGNINPLQPQTKHRQMKKKKKNPELQQGAVMLSLPSKEDVFQWAMKKAESFDRNLLARQCFIEGAEWMRNKIERGKGA